MSVLYGDEGIEHRLRDSGAKVLVTDAANRDRIPDGLAEVIFVLDSPDGGEREAGDVTSTPRSTASASYETVDTSADDPAQLYYSSGTTGLAKGILHAHRYLLAHEEFEFCHDVRDGELFHGSGEWAWAAGICPLLGPVALRRGRSYVLRAQGRLRPGGAAARPLEARRARTCSPRPPRCAR